MRFPALGKLQKIENRTPWIVAAIAAGLLGTGIVTATVLRSNEADTASVSDLIVPVEAADLTVRIEANGEVQAVERVNVSPKSQGRVEQVFVEQGDRVEAGEVIARMESRELETQRQQAAARVDRAQANLAELLAGSRPEEIDRAQASLAQAQSSAQQARAQADRERADLAELQAGARYEEIAQAEASVEQARSRVAEAESRLSLARQDTQRNERLYSGGAISRQDLDRARDEEDRAEAAVAQAEAAVTEAQRRLEQLRNGARIEEIDRAIAEVNAAEAEVQRREAAVAEARSQVEQVVTGARVEEIERARAEVAEAEAQVRFHEVQIDDTNVRAPFAGTVTQRFADPGAFVTPVTSASNVTSATSPSIVAIARGLEVLARVPEADINQIRPGQKVEIVADAFPDEVFEGQVKLIAPEAVEEERVTLFQVRLEVLSGQEQLKSGMNVDLTFLGDRLEDALVVPTVAIVTHQGQTGVLVPNSDNEPTFQEVTVGPSIGDRIQILDGIEAGERIFIGLPEGQELEDIFDEE